MDSKVEEENLKMTKPTRSSPSFSSSSLLDEIIVNCLAWTSRSFYPSLYLVSKSFYSLLSSPDIYTIRSQIGVKEPCLYVCLSNTTNHHSWFTITNSPDQTLINNGGEINKGELSLESVRLSSFTDSSYARLKNATNVVAGSQVYQIGGTVKDKRSKAVFVLDCQSHTWRRCPNMTVARKHTKSCFLDEKIYVIGGCGVTKEEPMNWGEVFDLKTQTWKPLPIPSDIISDPDLTISDPDLKVVVFGGRLYFMTKNYKYVYDQEEGRWVIPGVGFVSLEPLSSLVRPWCVIRNVLFIDECGKVKWYNPRRGKWFIVYRLDDLYMNRARDYRTIHLVNHGGKLVIIWQELIMFKNVPLNKKIWCAVIRLEKQYKSQFRGEVESCNVVLTLHKSYKVSSCLSVSV